MIAALNTAEIEGFLRVRCEKKLNCAKIKINIKYGIRKRQKCIPFQTLNQQIKLIYGQITQIRT